MIVIMVNNSKIIVSFDDTKFFSKYVNFLNTYHGDIRYIKFNSLYHYNSELLYIANAFGCGIFLDLKLYDTPETIKSTILALLNLNYNISAITVTFANNNYNSIKTALSICKYYNIRMLVVSQLSSCYDFSIDKYIDDVAELSQVYGVIDFICPASLVEDIAIIFPNLRFYTPSITLYRNEQYENQDNSLYWKDAIDNHATCVIFGRALINLIINDRYDEIEEIMSYGKVL